MTLHRPLALALLIAFIPALALAQKTTYDFDKTATFTAYKTYAFKDGTPSGQPLVDTGIVDPLPTDPAAKGLPRSAPNPDVVVLTTSPWTSNRTFRPTAPV